MVINELLPLIACAAVAIFSVLVFAAKLTLENLFSCTAERFLVASSVFVIAINTNFIILSLLPLEAPLLIFSLPLHFIFILILAYVVGVKGFRYLFNYTKIDVLSFFQKFNPIWYVIITFFTALLICYALQGAFTVSGGVDELSYHLPQAVGILQEGRVRAFDVPPSWVLHYPYGSAALWAWTMLFTGGDSLFRFVQFGFGLQLILSTGLLAWRMGADKISVLVAVFTVVAMPVFYILITTIGADLGNAAAIMSFLVFLSPSRNVQSANNPLEDLLAAGLFLAQAALIKIPVFALIVFSFAGLGFIIDRLGLKNGIRFLTQFAKNPTAWIVLLLLGMSFNVYILNWIETGNPIFPLTLRVGNLEIFKGTLKPIEDIVMGHSTFGSVREMSSLQRWHAVFSDWFQPMNQDAFGGAGPVFILSTLFMAVLGIIDKLRQPSGWNVAILFILLSIIVIPAAYLPRYSLAWLCLLSVIASLAYTKINKIFPGSVFVVVVILVFGSFLQINEMKNTFAWVTQMSLPEPWYSNRGRSILEKVDVDRSLAPTGAMTKVIRDNVGADSTLVYSVRVYAALMWNREFENKIKFVPGGYLNEIGNDNLTIEEQSGWLRRVKSIDPEWVLVYSMSGLAKCLIDNRSNMSYEIFFADKDTSHEESDRWNMVLLRRLK